MRRPRLLLVGALLALTSSAPSGAHAQSRTDADPSVQLPQDRGSAGLYQALLRLGTTASLMHTTAHPDDEHSAMLTYLARGRGVRTSLLTLNRGEGGANAIGPELFDALGVIRTEELALAGRYYGLAAQYYTNAVDYGYSKTLSEAFRSWNREAVLEDMVRIIRMERPLVVVSRFHGTERDGHGHHQAAGVLTPEAAEAAADPTRFPDQIEREGLSPWRVLRLFRGGVRPGEATDVTIEASGYASWLGDTFDRVAAQGLRLQRSQTAGRMRQRRGGAWYAYELMGGTPMGAASASFFDGLDTSLSGVFALTGERAPSGAVDALETAEAHLASALAALRVESHEATTRSLIAVLDGLREAHGRSAEAPLARALLERAMAHAHDALRHATGTALVATALREDTGDAVYRVAPGDTFQVRLDLSVARPPEGSDLGARLELPDEWAWSPRGEPLLERERNGGVRLRFTADVTVPLTAVPDDRYFRRGSLRENHYAVTDSSALHRAWGSPPVHAVGWVGPSDTDGRRFDVGTVVRGEDPMLPQGVLRRALRVDPALTVAIDPGTTVVPVGVDPEPVPVTLEVVQRGLRPQAGQAQIRVPTGWVVTPERAAFSLQRQGDRGVLTFTVTPDIEGPGAETIVAFAEVDGERSMTTQRVIRHTDLEERPMLSPSEARVHAIDVEVADGLRVGFVEGVGDEVPSAIAALGAEVTALTPEHLEASDLRAYDAIVLGTRAYAVRPELYPLNDRLLAYVAAGGHLVLLYQTQEYDPTTLAPEHAVLPPGAEEVSEEDAPVTLLAPSHPLLTRPNPISEADFDGWIEQRGSKFFSEWGEGFTPLVEMADEGQAPQRGIWLTAPHGEGHYTYVSLALHRQTPYGVPGAYRILANVLSYTSTP